MKMSWQTDYRQNLTFCGEVSIGDLAKLRLNRLDRMLVAMPCDNAADMLLFLELLFRRMQEQTNGK